MYGRRPEARDWVCLEKQPAVAAQWVARAMFVDARSHVGDPRRGSPCTVGSAGGQSITTVRQAPPVGAIDYRLHAPRPEEGQSSAATGYAGALAPKAPPRRQLAGAGLWGSCQPAERLTSDLARSVCFPPPSLIVVCRRETCSAEHSPGKACVRSAAIQRCEGSGPARRGEDAYRNACRAWRGWAALGGSGRANRMLARVLLANSSLLAKWLRTTTTK